MSVNQSSATTGSAISSSSDWSNDFGMLFGDYPGSSKRFGVAISGRKMVPDDVASVTATTTLNYVVSVTLRANADFVTISDSSITLLYQSLDASGLSRSRAPLAVFAIMTLGSNYKTFSCGSPNMDNGGVGSCSADFPTSWFDGLSEDALVSTVVEMTLDDVHRTVVVSNTLSTYLRRPADHSSSVVSGANMVLTVPQRVYYGGDSFQVPVVGFTGDQALTSWVLTLSYDPQLVQFFSLDTSSLYIDAVVSASEGKVSMSTSGTGTGVTEEQVTGSDIPVITLKLKMRHFWVPDAGQELDDVFSLMVNDMVNTFSIKFASDVPAIVRDSRDGSQIAAKLFVASNSVAGMFAYPSQAAIVNTFPFSDGNSFSPVITILAFSRKNGNLQVKTPSKSPISCRAADNTSSILEVTSECGVTASGAHSAGGTVNIVVSYDDIYFAEVSFVVWYPSVVAVEMAVDELKEMYVGSEQDLNNNCTMYQTGRVVASATFTSGGISKTVYITPFVSILADNSSVVDVRRDPSTGFITAQGLAAGSSALSVQVFSVNSSIVSTPVVITVSDSGSRVYDLTLIAYSGVVGNVAHSVSGNDVISPRFEFTDTLSTEGAEAYITALASMVDGTVLDVTYMLKSLVAINNNIELITTENWSPSLKVGVGASSFSGAALMGEFSVCGNSITGYGEVNLTMPDPITVTAVASTGKITSAADPASSSPFHVPVVCTLTSISVAFDDGTSKSVTTDSRISFELSTAAEGYGTLVYMVGTKIYVNESSPEYTSGMHKTFSVYAIYDGTVSTSVSIDIVTLSRISVSTAAYPSFGSSDSDGKTTISRMGCGDAIYQRLHAISHGFLTVASGQSEVALDISRFVTYTVVSGSDFVVVDENGVIAGIAAGDATLASVFTLYGESVVSVLSPIVSVSVLDSVESVTQIVVQVGGFGSGPTFNGVYGAEKTLSVTVIFGDGTIFLQATTGASIGWAPASALLTFESSEPDVISVSDEGVVTLRGNFPTEVSVSAISKCSADVNSGISLFANLEPVSYDVDFGKTSLAPFGTYSVGELFYMSIRINTGSFDVTSFQIVLSFDPRVIIVTSDSECSIGRDWQSAWDCTTNDPIDQVLIAGACGLVPSTKCKSKGLIEVANIRLRAIGAGTSFIKGTIVKIEDSSVVIADVDVLAGHGDVVVSANRRHLTAESVAREVHFDLDRHSQLVTALQAQVADYSAVEFESVELNSDPDPDPDVSVESAVWKSSYRKGHRKLQEGCVAGDTNGDGTFDISDVVTLQYAVGGSLDLSTFTPCQIVGMDPDRNGQRDGVDIQYLLRVVTKKYRFFKTLDFEHEHYFYTITGYVEDEAGQPVEFNGQTEVFFETSTTSAPLIMTVGADPAVTADGLVVARGKEGPNPGTFFIATESDGYAQEVSVAITLTTFDSFGYSSTTRQFLLYCSPSLASCAAVYGAGMSAFKPYVEMEMEERLPIAPTYKPTMEPTETPTYEPTHSPTRMPIIKKTKKPTAIPTHHPTHMPTTARPTRAPTDTNAPISKRPTSAPSSSPSSEPTGGDLLRS